MKHYRSRSSFWGQLAFTLLALFLAAIICAGGHPIAAVLLITLFSVATMRSPQQGYCNAVTLSVPEILKDILEAFRVETPELFGSNGISKDFSSNTAVLGDKVTAKIAHTPVTADYDPTPGVGFYSGAQDVTTLLEDVSVTLNQLRHVVVKIPYLTGLATKGVDLYKAAVGNIGFALGKYVVDQILFSAVNGSCSNFFQTSAAIYGLDEMERLRSQCNSQKMAGQSRFCFLNTALASGLGSDDRTKSKLFYGDLQGQEGYRVWTNMAGFATVREYPDFPAGNIDAAGLALDHRLAAVSVRRIKDMADAAKSLGVRKTMEFYPVRDEDSGLELTGISFQQGGTGDVFLAAAILFGVHVGNDGGAAGTMTDNAGCVIKSL